MLNVDATHCVDVVQEGDKSAVALFGFRETLFAEGVSSRGAFGALRRDGRQLGEGLAVDLADPCAEVAVSLAVEDRPVGHVYTAGGAFAMPRTRGGSVAWRRCEDVAELSRGAPALTRR